MMSKSLLISTEYFPPQIGGISHYMWGVASSLGPERVCCLTAQPGNRHGGVDGSAPRVYRRPRAFRGRSFHARAFRWGAAMAEIIGRERPSVVQISIAGDGSQALWLRRWLRLPFLVYAHGNEILHAIETGHPKKLLAIHRADRVLAVSRFTAGLVRKAGIAPERIAVVHPGCDVDRFRPRNVDMALRERLLGSRWRDRVILTVGALVSRKGHDMVIRALPKASRTIPDLTYVIVGEGPHRLALEDLARRIGVAERVVFAGTIGAEQLPFLYALSDVFVMPSREQGCDVEGFGLVFLEAGACAKPVVGGRSGGIPDALVEDVTGLLVDPHDPDDIASALTRLLSDQALARRLGEQGRARVVSDFRWAGVGDRVQQIVESVLEDRRRSM